MHTFLFTAIPFFNHLNWGGYLKTAVELTQRGHKVVWATEKGSAADVIRRAGVEVVALKTVGWHWDLPPEPHDYAPESWATYRMQRNFYSWYWPDKILPAAQSLIDLAHQIQAQAIIADPFVVAAPLAAEALALPYAVVGKPARPATPKTRFPSEAEAMQAGVDWLAEVCQKLQVEGRHFVELPTGLWPQSPHLHLSYFNPTWYDWGDRDILPQNKFAGGTKTEPTSPTPPWVTQLPVDDPLVGLTLGHMFNQEPQFLKMMVRIIANLHMFPVVITFDKMLSEGLAEMLPPDLQLILDDVDYDQLLPRLTMLVHHGGPATTHAAILHALPQVAIDPGAEDYTQGPLIARAGLGPHRHLEELIYENAQRLLADAIRNNQLKSRAQEYQAQFAALPGIPGAADWLEELVK